MSLKKMVLFFVININYCLAQTPLNINDVNSHSGDMITYDGNYYLFGEYRIPHPKEGRTANNQIITLYKSNNLKDWYPQVNPIDLSQDKNDYEVERPKIIYNNSDGKFYLFVHLQPHRKFSRGIGMVGVYSSEKVIGPYFQKNIYQVAPNRYVKFNFNSPDAEKKWIKFADSIYKDSIPQGQEVRDFYLASFKNKNYIIYTSEEGFSIQVSELGEEPYNPSSIFSRNLIGERHEAPVFLQKNGLGFVILSGIKGYNFTESKVYSFDSENISLKFISSFARGTSSQVNTTYSTQPAFVFKCLKNNNYVYVGDNWIYKKENKDISESRYKWFKINWENNTPYINEYSESSPEKICSEGT